MTDRTWWEIQELTSRSTDRWFNTAAFAFPAPGTFGNAGRNIVDGPGYYSVNASLVKNTHLNERFQSSVPGQKFSISSITQTSIYRITSSARRRSVRSSSHAIRGTYSLG